MLTPLNTDLEFVREVLLEHLPWTAHDFIREPEGFFRADRHLIVENMTRPLDQANDLRFRYRDDDLDVAVIAQRLPWDSDFFGYESARLHGIYPLKAPFFDFTLDYLPAITAFVQAARTHGIKYLSVRVFPEDLAAIRALCAAGFALISTLQYYHRSVQDYAYPQRFDARPATPDDISSVADTAKGEVNPFDHFHADPFITRENADRMMMKWVQASIAEGFADLTLVPNVAQPKAFCTVKYHLESSEIWDIRMAQLVLTAVDRTFKGWNLKCYSEAIYRLKEMDFDHVFVSAQNTSRAAIRQLEKMGFAYGRGEHIFRIIL